MSSLNGFDHDNNNGNGGGNGDNGCTESILVQTTDVDPHELEMINEAELVFKAMLDIFETRKALNSAFGLVPELNETCSNNMQYGHQVDCLSEQS